MNFKIYVCDTSVPPAYKISCIDVTLGLEGEGSEDVD
jgi:hypothetical protein